MTMKHRGYWGAYIVVTLVAFVWACPLTYELWMRLYDQMDCDWRLGVVTANECAMETLQIMYLPSFYDGGFSATAHLNVFLRDHPDMLYYLIERAELTLFLLIARVYVNGDVWRYWGISFIFMAMLYVVISWLTFFPYPGLYRPSQLVVHQLILAWITIFSINAVGQPVKFAAFLSSFGVISTILAIASRDTPTQSTVLPLVLSAVVCSSHDALVKGAREWWAAFSYYALPLTHHTLYAVYRTTTLCRRDHVYFFKQYANVALEHEQIFYI